MSNIIGNVGFDIFDDDPIIIVEEWRPVPGWVGIYEVSNRGRVRSVGRWIEDSIGRLKYYDSNYLTLYKNVGGYWCCRLQSRPDRMCVGYKIHRLVAAAFCGFNLKSKLTIDHVNGNKLDNRPQNLEPVTAEENTKRGWKMNRYRYTTNKALTFDQACEIRKLYETGEYSQQQIADIYNVRLRIINQIVNKRTYIREKWNRRPLDGSRPIYGKHIKKTDNGWHEDKGSKSVLSKLTEKDVYLIRRMNSIGVKQIYLARMFNVSKQSINNIVHNKTYTKEGYENKWYQYS